MARKLLCARRKAWMSAGGSDKVNSSEGGEYTGSFTRKWDSELASPLGRMVDAANNTKRKRKWPISGCLMRRRKNVIFNTNE